MDYFEAALYNNIIAIKDYLKFGDVNKIDSYGNSLLHYAVKGNSMEVAILLLDNHINPNLQNNELETPLFLAMQSSHIGMIKLLLRYKASLDCKTKNGETILFRVILSNRKDLIKLMLASQNYDIDEVNNNNENILHYAIKAHNYEIIYHVLKKYPEMIYSKNYNKTNLLSYAIIYNDFELVKLFSKKISVYESDKENNSAIHYAAKKGSREIIEYLLNTFKPIIPGKNKRGQKVFDLVESNPFDVKYLFESYIYSNDYKEYINLYPYHYAVLNRDESFLITMPKNYEKKDSQGQTVLELAKIQGIKSIIKLIQ